MKPLNIAKTIVRNQSGEFLVLRSSEWPENPVRSLQPDIAGGVVDEGENHLMSAARELEEEAGIIVNQEDLQLVWAGSEIDEAKKAAINRLIFFVLVPDDVKITLSWEHCEYWWSSFEDLVALDWREPYAEIFRFFDKAGYSNTR